MPNARTSESPHQACQVFDFDRALLGACPAGRKTDLMMEAELLASVFAPNRDSAELERMAEQLSSGQRDGEMSRAHARLLAAALRDLAHKADS
ncbi:MAG: hypothetical protein AB1942_14450 [Pseudomonadota bacterium]